MASPRLRRLATYLPPSEESVTLSATYIVPTCHWLCSGSILHHEAMRAARHSAATCRTLSVDSAFKRKGATCLPFLSSGLASDDGKSAVPRRARSKQATRFDVTRALRVCAPEFQLLQRLDKWPVARLLYSKRSTSEVQMQFSACKTSTPAIKGYCRSAVCRAGPAHGGQL